MKGILALLIGVFIAFLVGGSLIDQVADDSHTVIDDSDVQSFAGMDTLAGLLPLLFVLVPLIGVARVIR